MKIKTAVAAVVIILLSSVPQAALAQRRTSQAQELRELREEVRRLKEEQEAMRKDLMEIRRLLEQARAGQPARPAAPEFVSVDDDPAQGSAEARVVIIDFSDYQCPFCGRFVRETKPQLEKDYISTGKVRYVFRDLPLEAIHPQALKAAEAANCAGDQGKFWEMYELLFRNQSALAPANLAQYSQTLALDAAKFNACLDTNKYAAEIRKDMADAAAANIEGTPNFVIGITNPRDPRDPRIKVLRIVTGAQPYPVFKSLLDAALSVAAAEQK